MCADRPVPTETEQRSEGRCEPSDHQRREGKAEEIWGWCAWGQAITLEIPLSSRSEERGAARGLRCPPGRVPKHLHWSLPSSDWLLGSGRGHRGRSAKAILGRLPRPRRLAAGRQDQQALGTQRRWVGAGPLCSDIKRCQAERLELAAPGRGGPEPRRGSRQQGSEDAKWTGKHANPRSNSQCQLCNFRRPACRRLEGLSLLDPDLTQRRGMSCDILHFHEKSCFHGVSSS